MIMKKNFLNIPGPVFTLLFFVMPVLSLPAWSQTGKSILPKIETSNGRHTLLVDGKPYFIFGGQAHNSSAWPAMMPKVWAAIDSMHANTLEVPLYWEQIEPEQGKFDFSMVDILLNQAREHEVRLVFLWFATWKNGSNHYIPGWMKMDPEKYPNLMNNEGRRVDSPSPHSEAAMEADTKAYVKLMEHLKASDPQHTVIMMQIENEPGSWYSVRDYSPEARKIFNSQVPQELLKPGVLKSLNKAVKAKGSWTDVFGNDADEYFEAWFVARYIENIAKAGKAVYPLPYYVNAALRIPFGNPPAGTYESGGPTDNVIPLWKAAAPDIDLLAPDIYLSGTDTVMEVLKKYNLPDNPLFVPEIAFHENYLKYLYAVLAGGGIGFSPFGIDDNSIGEYKEENFTRIAPFAREYSVLSPMMRELAEWSYDGKIKAVIEREDHKPQTIDLGNWQAMVGFGTGRGPRPRTNLQPLGRMLIVQLNPNEFLVTGTRSRITFKPAGRNAGKEWQFMKVEEGYYKDGSFTTQRILNGDETDWGGPVIGIDPVVLWISISTR